MRSCESGGVMSPEMRLELQRLLSTLCDGDLSDADHARLEELLASEPECRRHYLEYLDLHARLLVHPIASSSDSGQPNDLVAAIDAADLANATPLAFASAVSPRDRRKQRWSQAVRYGMVAASTLAASVLLQVYLWQPPAPTPLPIKPLPANPGVMGYVATLIQTADCVWADPAEPSPVGARLQPGKLRLQEGLARIRFDAGAELLVEGPVALHLDSQTAATISSGKVVFHSDEMAAPFELHTPTATLVDIGTSYGVEVGADAEEVHVFEGDVQRMPRRALAWNEPEYIKAGEARRFVSAPRGAGQPTTFDPARFMRRVPLLAKAAPDGASGLLAYEGFDYKVAEDFHTGKANGGIGWASPWLMTAAHPLEWGEKKRLPLNSGESLVRPDAATPSIGGRFDHAGFGVYYRRLATPIRMDRDGVYYFSCLLRRSGPQGDPFNVVAIKLRPHETPQQKPEFSTRLAIGIGGCNQAFARLGEHSSRVSVPIGSGVTYLLVTKIVASRSTSDQVFVRVFAPREPVGSEEPASWSLTSPSFHSDLTFEWLGVHINSKHRQMIDEIRVGTTWASVTAPWIAVPVAKAGQP